MQKSMLCWRCDVLSPMFVHCHAITTNLYPHHDFLSVCFLKNDWSSFAFLGLWEYSKTRATYLIFWYRIDLFELRIVPKIPFRALFFKDVCKIVYPFVNRFMYDVQTKPTSSVCAPWIHLGNTVHCVRPLNDFVFLAFENILVIWPFSGCNISGVDCRQATLLIPAHPFVLQINTLLHVSSACMCKCMCVCVFMTFDDGYSKLTQVHHGCSRTFSPNKICIYVRFQNPFYLIYVAQRKTILCIFHLASELKVQNHFIIVSMVSFAMFVSFVGGYRVKQAKLTR